MHRSRCKDHWIFSLILTDVALRLSEPASGRFMRRQWHSLVSPYLPSSFLLCLLPLFSNHVASSSFKNHFTLGKMHFRPMLLSVCVCALVWMLNSISSSNAVSFIIDGRAGAWRASHACELEFVSERPEGRGDAALCIHLASESWLASVTYCNWGQCFSSSLRFPTSKPRSEA